MDYNVKVKKVECMYSMVLRVHYYCIICSVFYRQPPLLVLNFLCLDKPIIVVFASEQNKEIVTIGDTVKIICKGVAFPPADYTLFHNETRLTDVVDGVKTISSASRNDAGKYVCVARNSLGNVLKSFFLSVNDVLQKPTTILTSTNIKGTYIFLVRFVVYILLVNFQLRLRVYSTNIYCFQFLNILSK